MTRVTGGSRERQSDRESRGRRSLASRLRARGDRARVSVAGARDGIHARRAGERFIAVALFLCGPLASSRAFKSLINLSNAFLYLSWSFHPRKSPMCRACRISAAHASFAPMNALSNRIGNKTVRSCFRSFSNAVPTHAATPIRNCVSGTAESLKTVGFGALRPPQRFECTSPLTGALGHHDSPRVRPRTQRGL